MAVVIVLGALLGAVDLGGDLAQGAPLALVRRAHRIGDRGGAVGQALVGVGERGGAFGAR